MIGRTGVSSSVARTMVAESRKPFGNPNRTSARDEGSLPTVSSESTGRIGFWVTNVLNAVARTSDCLLERSPCPAHPAVTKVVNVAAVLDVERADPDPVGASAVIRRAMASVLSPPGEGDLARRRPR